MRNIKIASPTEVGRRLNAARTRLKIPAEKLAKTVGTTGTTIRRWEIADHEYQGGCVEVARAGAILGMEPNQLFLQEPQSGEQSAWTDEEVAALRDLLTEISKTNKDAKTRPGKLIAERVTALIRVFTLNEGCIAADQSQPPN